MPTEPKYAEMLEQAKKMRDLADSFISTLTPYVGDEESEEDDGYEGEPEESGDLSEEEPMMNPPKGKNLAIILALKKKMKK